MGGLYAQCFFKIILDLVIFFLWMAERIIKRQEKMIEVLNEGIDELQNEYTYKAYIHAEKWETALANCKYYMGKYLAAKA